MEDKYSAILPFKFLRVTKEEALRDGLKEWKFIVKNQREFYRRRMIPITCLEAVSRAGSWKNCSSFHPSWRFHPFVCTDFVCTKTGMHMGT